MIKGKENKKFTKNELKMIRLVKIAEQIVLKEDKKLFEELAKY